MYLHRIQIAGHTFNVKWMNREALSFFLSSEIFLVWQSIKSERFVTYFRFVFARFVNKFNFSIRIAYDMCHAPYRLENFRFNKMLNPRITSDRNRVNSEKLLLVSFCDQIS